MRRAAARYVCVANTIYACSVRYVCLRKHDMISIPERTGIEIAVYIRPISIDQPKGSFMRPHWMSVRVL